MCAKDNELTCVELEVVYSIRYKRCANVCVHMLVLMIQVQLEKKKTSRLYNVNTPVRRLEPKNIQTHAGTSEKTSKSRIWCGLFMSNGQ